MSKQEKIAVIGGGPAGAFAASLLASGGKNVLLFEERLAWEKPCGGGLTYRALRQFPFLQETQVEHRTVADCELISPSGERARFRLRHPLVIFSRYALNGLLLDRAARAGVNIHKERVTRIEKADAGWHLATTGQEYDVSKIVLATGARNSFRGQFAPPFAPNDFLVTAGYFIPGSTSTVQVQFINGINGYIWIFPRTNHISAGIAGKMGEISTSELRRMLEIWLDEHGFSLAGARFFSHIIPSLRADVLRSLEVIGDGWAMIGDCAGLVDSITGEGIHYALQSAKLCADAIVADRLEDYPAALEEEVLPELILAAQVSAHFYGGQVFGESVVERMVKLTNQSEGIRDLMRDLFAGTQGYRDLRSRLYRALPSLIAEGLAGAMRLPWGGVAPDPLAE
jgi:flavin-dependent dehydrogenase